jgi:hypothetical protein
MAQIAASLADLLINNERVSYIPNTLSYNLGIPTTQSNPAISGNTVIQNYSRDYSQAKGMVKFDMVNTRENLTFFKNWVANYQANAIQMIFDNGTTVLYATAAIKSQTDFSTGNDSKLTVEFEADQAVSR